MDHHNVSTLSSKDMCLKLWEITKSSLEGYWHKYTLQEEIIANNFYPTDININSDDKANTLDSSEVALDKRKRLDIKYRKGI